MTKKRDRALDNILMYNSGPCRKSPNNLALLKFASLEYCENGVLLAFVHITRSAGGKGSGIVN